ncbi:MAG: hypothetical protein ACLS43_10760 [Evtepia gabavorous]
MVIPCSWPPSPRRRHGGKHRPHQNQWPLDAAAGGGQPVPGGCSAPGLAPRLSGSGPNLRHMFEKIQTYSFSNIDKFSTSSLITRLTTDVTNVQNAT